MNGEQEQEQLEAAKRLIAMLSRACRQTRVYMEGISSLDEKKIKRLLQDAIKASDKFMNAK